MLRADPVEVPAPETGAQGAQAQGAPRVRKVPRVQNLRNLPEGITGEEEGTGALDLEVPLKLNKNWKAKVQIV